MNYQSSQSTSSGVSLKDAHQQLEAAEGASRRLQITLGVWLAAAVLSYLVSHTLSEHAASLLSQAAVVCAAMGLVYAGRWLQSLKALSWFRSRVQKPSEIDWSEIPESGTAHELRLFSSVEEATSRGWAAGPTVAMFGGTPVPEWMEYDGHRYLFDGLVSSSRLGFVPENMRVFGRLGFLASPEDSESLNPKDPQPEPSNSPADSPPSWA